MAHLVGLSGSVEGKTWPIEHGLTLGREAHNSIAMPDNRKASRDHAKVWREGQGRYSVADLGSTNGTLVNDDRVARQALADGDEIRVGDATFRFELDEDEKPKKREPTARMSELFGHAPATGGPPPTTATNPAAAVGGGAAAGGPSIELKQRVLQYHKKGGKGTVASWDMGQVGGWQKWVLVLVALAVLTVVFLFVRGSL